jgi:hypothetical protein
LNPCLETSRGVFRAATCLCAQRLPLEGMRGSVARTYKWLGSCLLIGHPRRYEVYEIDCGTKVSKMSERPYTKDGRLADVLALIQVLALDKSTYRSEDGITAKELVKPSSAESVVVLATEHPEFFRVNPAREHCISLLARHVQPKDPVQDTRLPLTSEFTRMLMELLLICMTAKSQRQNGGRRGCP